MIDIAENQPQGRWRRGYDKTSAHYVGKLGIYSGPFNSKR
jgi:hypothetical protein